ncbi:hypothetical protein H5410_040598 [Solanum commersonii]|uniref:Uncharacterized protein n=1 Tax=Solanum commersonii TaxID=4109 RepID=A0A9J5XRW8_SOLCO|nr:hypothetical protein H5410_040598 [Solanum commersonii]
MVKNEINSVCWSYSLAFIEYLITGTPMQPPNTELCDNTVGRMQWVWTAGIEDVDLLEMYLIFGNVGKHFVVTSRSRGRTLLITPLKSYVVDVVAFSNPCRMLVEGFSSWP